jgi:hypothetical protein
MLGARSIPVPKGRLGTRSLGALLCSARARRATALLSLEEGERKGEIVFVQGRVLRAVTSEPASYIGALLCKRGVLDPRLLGDTLEEMHRTGRLHGQILLERKLVTPAQLSEALAEQTRHRILHLFSFCDQATYQVSELSAPSSSARDHGRPTVDPWPLVYRGLCLNPRPELVRGAVDRLDGLLRLRDMRVLDELRLEPAERALCEELGTRPTAVADLLGDARVPRPRAELLLYILALGRHLERTAADVVNPAQLGASGVRAHAAACAERAPHACLDVAEDATREEIRAAYFRLARVWHPDRLPTALADVRPACEEVFAKMTDAFRALMEKPLATDALREPMGRDSAAPPSGRPVLVSLPPPTVTMTDVDRALSRADFQKAGRLASALVRTGAHGPAARAVIAMCDAAGANASFDQVDGAIASLDKIIGGDSECVRALFYRGVLAKRGGRIDAAVRDFRSVLRLDPTHVDAQRELRLADARARSASGAQTGTNHPATDAPRAPHARRASDRDRTDLEPLPAPPHQPGSGLRALLTKGVRRS